MKVIPWGFFLLYSAFLFLSYPQIKSAIENEELWLIDWTDDIFFE